MTTLGELNTSSLGPRRARRARVVAAFGAAFALALSIAACSSSGNGSTGGGGGGVTGGSTNSGSSNAAVEAVKQLVAAAEAPPQLSSPPPAFDASSAKGKTVEWLSLGAQVAATPLLYDNGFKIAAQQVGIKSEFFDGKSDSSTYPRGFDQALSNHASAIVLQSIPATLVAASIADANKAHVPVIESFNHDAGQGPSDGVYAEVAFCDSCIGKLMADYAIADSDGHVNGAIIMSSDVTSQPYVDALQAELAKVCPDTCKAKVYDVPVSDWAKSLPSVTQTAVSSSDLNYLFPLFDHEALYVVPAVHAANAQDRVKVVTFNASADGMGYLAKHDVIAADIGAPDPWVGWAMMDQTLRALTGQPPVDNENIPLRLFTADNIGSIDLNDKDENWYGGSGYQAAYLKTWGLG